MIISVLGAGAWGTAAANHLAKKGNVVKLWVREPELFHALESSYENSVFLPGVALSKNLSFTQDFQELCNGSEVFIVASPHRFLRSMISEVKEFLLPQIYIVNLSKGIEKTTFFTPSQVILEVLGKNFQKIATLSGPNMAKEVAEEKPLFSVFASSSQEALHFLPQIFETEFFHIETSDDLIGVELCGALKGIIACAANMVSSFTKSENARAAVLVQGMKELVLVGEHFGAKKETVMGLSGLGDVLVSTYSLFGRNARAGLLFSEGKSFDEVEKALFGKTVEGVHAAESVFVYNEATMHLSLPVMYGVYRVAYERKSVKEVVREMLREVC